jgi:hypothetical protein
VPSTRSAISAIVSSLSSAWAGAVNCRPTGIAGAVPAERHRDCAEAEVVDPSGVSDDAAIDPKVAVGVRDVRHQRRRQAQGR